MKYENPILNERETTHGDYAHTAEAAQVIKRQVRATLHKAGIKLNPMQSESLDQIATKIARICSGNPDDPEHWKDIAGYADLISARLRPSAAPLTGLAGKVLYKDDSDIINNSPVIRPANFGNSPEGTSA